MEEILTWKEKGNSFFREQKYEEAKEGYLKAFHLLEEAYKEKEGKIVDYGTQQAIICSNLAESCLAQGEFLDAIIACKASLIRNPRSQKTWNRLARAYQALGYTEAALECYQEVQHLGSVSSLESSAIDFCSEYSKKSLRPLQKNRATSSFSLLMQMANRIANPEIAKSLIHALDILNSNNIFRPSIEDAISAGKPPQEDNDIYPHIVIIEFARLIVSHVIHPLLNAPNPDKKVLLFNILSLSGKVFVDGDADTFYSSCETLREGLFTPLEGLIGEKEQRGQEGKEQKEEEDNQMPYFSSNLFAGLQRFWGKEYRPLNVSDSIARSRLFAADANSTCSIDLEVDKENKKKKLWKEPLARISFWTEMIEPYLTEISENSKALTTQEIRRYMYLMDIRGCCLNLFLNCDWTNKEMTKTSIFINMTTSSQIHDSLDIPTHIRSKEYIRQYRGMYQAVASDLRHYDKQWSTYHLTEYMQTSSPSVEMLQAMCEQSYMQCINAFDTLLKGLMHYFSNKWGIQKENFLLSICDYETRCKVFHLSPLSNPPQRRSTSHHKEHPAINAIYDTHGLNHDICRSLLEVIGQCNRDGSKEIKSEDIYLTKDSRECQLYVGYILLLLIHHYYGTCMRNGVVSKEEFGNNNFVEMKGLMIDSVMYSICLISSTTLSNTPPAILKTRDYYVFQQAQLLVNTYICNIVNDIVQ